MTVGMHVEIRKIGDVVVLDLQGKLTAGLGDQILRDTLSELFAQNWTRILLNLSDVSFMDSAGVGELVAGLRNAKKRGVALKLLNASERVHSTLYIAKLLPIFEIYQDEQEALQRFGPPPPRPS
jgi:anti-sigma B factor antagonist